MIRAARAEDVPAIHRLIRELARYEHSLEQVTGTEEDLRRSLFGGNPAIYAHVAAGKVWGATRTGERSWALLCGS